MDTTLVVNILVTQLDNILATLESQLLATREVHISETTLKWKEVWLTFPLDSMLAIREAPINKTQAVSMATIVEAST